MSFSCGCSLEAQDKQKAFEFESGSHKLKAFVVIEKLNVPWALAFLPDGGLLITEKEGRLLWKKPGSKKLLEVSGVPKVYDGDQGGLMDVVLHPEFQKKPWLYLTYSINQDGKKTTRLSRFLWDQNSPHGSIKNKEILFTAKPFFRTSHHFGSRLVFDKKNYLFLTIGDRGRRDLAQSLSTHNGKVIRLMEDGRIPQDNPFASTGKKEKGKNPQALAEIWSYGHRNPQGLVMKGDELWLHEHGPRGGDEINPIFKGKNYGWPIVTYGKEYIGGKIGEGFTKKGMEDPKKYYIPSIAPSGMAYYNGSRFPFWKDSFFIGALVLRHLNRVSVKDFNQEERLLLNLKKRVRDVRVGPDGFIYAALEKGPLLRIEKAK